MVRSARASYTARRATRRARRNIALHQADDDVSARARTMTNRPAHRNVPTTTIGMQTYAPVFGPNVAFDVAAANTSDLG